MTDEAEKRGTTARVDETTERLMKAKEQARIEEIQRDEKFLYYLGALLKRTEAMKLKAIEETPIVLGRVWSALMTRAQDPQSVANATFIFLSGMFLALLQWGFKAETIAGLVSRALNNAIESHKETNKETH